jgi:hypothetical protein
MLEPSSTATRTYLSIHRRAILLPALQWRDQQGTIATPNESNEARLNDKLMARGAKDMTNKQLSNQRSTSNPPRNDALPPIKTTTIVNHIDDSVHHDTVQALIEPGASQQTSTREPIGKNKLVDFEQFIATTCTEIYREISGGRLEDAKD